MDQTELLWAFLLADDIDNVKKLNPEHIDWSTLSEPIGMPLLVECVNMVLPGLALLRVSFYDVLFLGLTKRPYFRVDFLFLVLLKQIMQIQAGGSCSAHEDRTKRFLDCIEWFVSCGASPTQKCSQESTWSKSIFKKNNKEGTTITVPLFHFIKMLFNVLLFK